MEQISVGDTSCPKCSGILALQSIYVEVDKTTIYYICGNCYAEYYTVEIFEVLSDLDNGQEK